MAQLWPHFESYWDFKSTRGSPDMIHLIIYASTVFLSIFKATTGCPPKKCKFCVNALFSLMKCTREKSRMSFESSGNFLSNKHKDILILWKMAEKNEVKDAYPLQKVKKKHQNICILTKMFPLLPRLYWPPEFIIKLERHLLSNGSYLVSLW